MSCTRCRLSAGRTQVVWASGTDDADLMFIGEGPGFHEDRQGLPFVGAAGQLLDRLLGEIGLHRDQVYVCNTVKCLSYAAPVQLGDGSWKRIGRLVHSKYDGLVMSVDDDGRLVRRRVTGWHASPLAGRRLFRLSFASAKRNGRHRAGVEVTGDHPVLTDRGWTAVQDLPGDARIATGQGLSSLAFDVVLGTMLGDGHLDSRRASLSFGHTARQADYASFKLSLITELAPRLSTALVAAVSGGAFTYPVVRVDTRAHRALWVLRRDFYDARKRVPRWVAKRLNERSLAFWFMDDGHTRIRPGKKPLAEIATVAFDDQDRGILLEGLRKLGVAGQSSRKRLTFGVAATRRLSELIAPYVPPSMRYKLDPEVARLIPFDPDRFGAGLPEVLYDDVEVSEVPGERGFDDSVYCIDVEGTHNFVTTGGVVHNCRPPGNRDPLPDELEACKPYLDAQVRLVDPNVIVTLGNFATRYVLGRPVAISRVRGQKNVVDGRVVIPTFHPAAVLRGGGDASRQMEALREDFATIKATLQEMAERRGPPVEEQLGLF
jgi:uracil-DNA glycosylase family 4